KMSKSLIKLNLRRLSHQQVLDLANSVVVALTAAVATYAVPNPALAGVSTDATALSDAITAWGPKGNRGSRLDHINLLVARTQVELDLTMLSEYAMNTTPYDLAALATTGFALKKTKTPQGILEAPQN